jgi:CubicO group peptidase (beta-lactamase class C family)
VPLTARLELGFAEHPDADDGALSRLVAEAAAEPADDAAVSVRPWSYSNLGWCLVGRALEVAVGRPWEEAMRTALAPVGLTATVFGRDTSARRATGHDVTPDGPTAVPAMDSRAYGPAGTHTTSTVDDLLRLAQRHLTDPALAPLREVHSSSAIPGWLDGWCLGWATFAWQGGTVWGWEGIVDGERAALRLLPREGAAFVVLTNASTGRAVHRALLADLGPAVVGHGPVPLDLVAHPGAAGDLSRYAGVYGWPDRTVGVEAHGDALLVTADDRRAEAWPVDQRTFVLDPPDADDPAMTFALDEHGEPQALYEQMWALPRR